MYVYKQTNPFSRSDVHLQSILYSLLLPWERPSYAKTETDRIPEKKIGNLENLLLLCTVAYLILVPLIFWFQSKNALNAQAHLAVSYSFTSVYQTLSCKSNNQTMFCHHSLIYSKNIIVHVRLGSQLRFCTKTCIYRNEWQYYSAKRAGDWMLHLNGSGC